MIKSIPRGSRSEKKAGPSRIEGRGIPRGIPKSHKLHLKNFCIYWLEVHSEGPFNKALDEQQIVPFFSINTNIDFDHHPSKKVARNL